MKNPERKKRDGKAFAALSVWVLLLFVLPCAASENQKSFLDALDSYKEGDYNTAAEKWESIAETGVRNPELFYNIGNAHMKKEDTGRAILWYERALRLSPRNPDLIFNLAYAQSRVRDQKEEKTSAVYRVLFFWKEILSEEAVKWTGIFFHLVFWSLVIFRTIKRRKIFAAHVWLALLVSLIFIGTAFRQFYHSAEIRYAVVLPEKVSIRSGLDENATELFVLHAGTRVKVEKENRDYIRIYFSEGKIGWMKKNDAGII